jgi:mannose-6-phosphate isomerase-like protein (cupin superfamily)
MLKSMEAIRIAQAELTEVIDVFGASMAVLGDPANLPFLLCKHVAPPGYAVPLHAHEHDDEFFVMLEGELTVIGPEGEHRIRPGASVELPRGIPHGFRNDSPAPAQLLVMASPGRYAAEMFRHFDRAGRGPFPLTPAGIPLIAGQYGVRFI